MPFGQVGNLLLNNRVNNVKTGKDYPKTAFLEGLSEPVFETGILQSPTF